MLQELMPIYSKDGTCQTIKEYVERYNDAEIDGIKQDIEDLKVDKVDKVENAVEGDVAGLTASGNIFDTGISLYGEKTYDYAEVLNIKNALPIPAVDCKVKVKPIQDLHGYAHPWVGGAGKNKFNINKVVEEGATVTVSNDILTITGIASRAKGYLLGFNIVYDAESTYTLSFTIDSISYYAGQTLFFGFVIRKSDNTYRYINTANTNTTGDKSVSVTLATGETIERIDFNVNDSGNDLSDPCTFVLSKVQLEKGSSKTSFAPYSNICPISGTDEVEIEVSDGESEPTTTIPLPSTLYDADVDVTEGDADSRYGYIASYNGETLPGAWISDRDVYTGSNSPTIGAEVCYELATPTTISFTPADVELLEGTNVVSANNGDISMTVKYDRLADLEDRVTALENA